jgi:hypothetical protein
MKTEVEPTADGWIRRTYHEEGHRHPFLVEHHIDADGFETHEVQVYAGGKVVALESVTRAKEEQ